jgi:hypothetical protein
VVGEAGRPPRPHGGEEEEHVAVARRGGESAEEHVEGGGAAVQGGVEHRARGRRWKGRRRCACAARRAAFV